jgi:orotate phosphoribosyltransferase
MKKKEKLVLDLFKYRCIEFGRFKLKSGIISPIYIDIRKLVSFPKLMKRTAAVYWSILKELKFDRLAGVPYAALPIVSVISVKYNLPLVYTRKEQQNHGITKSVQGEYQKGEKVVVIDDIVTTGDSKLMAIKPLEKSGLKVRDVVILIDREQGGKEKLATKGYKLHAVFLITEVLKILLNKRKISQKKYKKVVDYIDKTRRE